MSTNDDRTLQSSDRHRARLVAGRYELEKKIGGGGMGQVYLAKQAGVGNRVALKFLAPQLCNDEGFVKRFLQEARVSLEVTHPGAAQLLDAGRDDDGQLYIAFEFVEGEDLRERLERDRALSFSEAREIALKIAEVLAFAHARGIVHRDIKPENVRIRKDLAGTHVKVLDFGIARLTQDAGARLTADGGLAGTPRYMAPEQIRAENVDARADVYSLGLLLFEMVTGREAFTSSSTPALLMSQLQDPLPRIRDAQPARDFPALDEVLQRACAKDRTQRFPDMGAFISALQALPEPQWGRASTPVHPPAPPVVPLGERATPAPDQREAARPVPWALLLLALLVAGGGVAAFRLMTRKPDVAVVTPPPPLVPQSPTGPWGCVELSVFDPSLTSLDIPELEQRVLRSRVSMPSANVKQLEMLKASVENYAPAKRGCMYRASLVGVLAGEQTVFKTLPEAWGQRHEVKTLEQMFLELPLKQRWSQAQRKDVLAQIENVFIASLKQDHPDDGDYWRRMYLGIELTCEVTDEALEKLGAKRPGSCLNLAPR